MRVLFATNYFIFATIKEQQEYINNKKYSQKYSQTYNNRPSFLFREGNSFPRALFKKTVSFEEQIRSKDK